MKTAKRPTIALVLLMFFAAPGYAATRYVDVDGSDDEGLNPCLNPLAPCRTIGHAIGRSAVFGGDAIVIAPGIYTERLVINKALSLEGAGRGATIIQAHETQGQATGAVIEVRNPDSVSMKLAISQVTIRHGASGAGGGLVNFSNGPVELEVSDVIFTQNQATLWGGGIYWAINPNSANDRFRLVNVTFDANEAGIQGGGLFILRGAPRLEKVTFRDNRAEQGGGMFSVNSSFLELDNATFINNQAIAGGGGGMFTDSSTLVLRNGRFVHNAAAGAGGGMRNVGGSLVRVYNGLFCNNSAGFGGGLSNSGGEIRLYNATLGANQSFEGGGGGVRNFAGSRAWLYNTIVWSNQANEGSGGHQIWNTQDSQATLEYSLYGHEPGDIVQGGGFSALASLTQAPRFIELATCNLRLSDDSPAVDTGSPTLASGYPSGSNGSPIDLDGRPRLYGVRVDIGAYEWQPLPDEIFSDRYEQ